MQKTRVCANTFGCRNLYCQIRVIPSSGEIEYVDMHLPSFGVECADRVEMRVNDEQDESEF